MKLVPVTLRAANAFVLLHHRHHKTARGCVTCLGVEVAGELRGVAVIGRPVARMLQDGRTAEVTRLCVIEGERNGASFLLGAARRAALALGYSRLLTYTLASEPGTSLRAAGWKPDGASEGGTWSRPSRGRIDKHPTEAKQRWRAW